MKIPKIGEEIWMPGGKRKVLAVRRKVTEVREHDLNNGGEIEYGHCKKVEHSLLVAGMGEFDRPSSFIWEDNINKQQEYFREVFERRNCRKCQFPLPWNKCEIHS